MRNDCVGFSAQRFEYLCRRRCYSGRGAIVRGGQSDLPLAHELGHRTRSTGTPIRSVRPSLLEGDVADLLSTGKLSEDFEYPRDVVDHRRVTACGSFFQACGSVAAADG
jgi:hypothetical protein